MYRPLQWQKILFCSHPVVSKHEKRGLQEDRVVLFIEIQSVTQPKHTEEAAQGRAPADLWQGPFPSSAAGKERLPRQSSAAELCQPRKVGLATGCPQQGTPSRNLKKTFHQASRQTRTQQSRTLSAHLCQTTGKGERTDCSTKDKWLGGRSGNRPRCIAEELQKQRAGDEWGLCNQRARKPEAGVGHPLWDCPHSSPWQQRLFPNSGILVHLIMTLYSIWNILIAFLTSHPRLWILAQAGSCPTFAVWWYTQFHRPFYFLNGVWISTAEWVPPRPRYVTGSSSLGRAAGDWAVQRQPGGFLRPIKGYNQRCILQQLNHKFF